MEYDQILTTKQRKAFLKLAIDKLEELVRLPETKDLLEEIELASIGHYVDRASSESNCWAKDELLILSQIGLIERKYILGPRPPLFTILRFRRRILKQSIVPEEDYEKIIEHYKLKPTDLQRLIYDLRKVPSVRPKVSRRKNKAY